MSTFNLSAFERDQVRDIYDDRDRNRKNRDSVRGVSDDSDCRGRNNDSVRGISEDNKNRDSVRGIFDDRDRNDENQGNNRNQCTNNGDVLGTTRNECDSRRLKEECIIALKVYDSCRKQECLTEREIGPARAAEDVCIGDEYIREGDVIDPPSDAAAVTIDRLRIKKIIIVDKRPNELRRGFWNIDLKYVFEYRLTFREANGCVITSIKANSIFNKQITLFGSVGSDLVIGTDLFSFQNGDSETLDADPFIVVEAKAVALDAKLSYQRRNNVRCEDLSPQPNAVLVTIGLFSIIKLIRIVNLTVESRGFCIPEECDDVSALNPCEFFDNLDFPMDVFAPPQKPEFLAGISGNIPNRNGNNNGNCNCHSC